MYLMSGVKVRSIACAAVGALGLIASNVDAATTADVIFVVDESGSMSGEHTWLGTMIGQLDAGLIAAGVTGNRYGLVGFGAASSGGHVVGGHQHNVGGGQFGTAVEFAAATSGLVVTGATEDGWAGIHYALNNYAFRSDAALNIVLITDEDRDNTDGSLSVSSILAELTNRNALLNSVVNATFSNNALGVDSGGTGYVASGGTYTTVSPASAISGAGATLANYVDLAWDSGGAAWDLNKLRAGGLTAQAFTEAFVDIKVDEIIVQPPAAVPLPAAALGGMALISMVGAGRLRRRPSAAA